MIGNLNPECPQGMIGERQQAQFILPKRLKPAFKGVWSAIAHSAPLPLPDTKPG